MTQPTIGRIVHYKSYGTPGGEFTPECRPAIITEVRDGEVGLVVVNPTGLFFHPIADPASNRESVPHDESQERGGTWHWPCVIV